MGKSIDLTGKRFGLLTALEKLPERKNGQAFRWVCRCDCGSVRDYNYASLTQGKSTTCEWATLSMQSFDQKQKKHNTSGRTGVRWREDRNVWEASICKNRKIIQLYYGSSFEEACKAREKAELELYGFIKE